MADIKITDLTAYTDPVSTDVLPIVDVSNDLTKKVSIADLLENAGTGSVTAPSFSFDGDNNTGVYRPGADQLALTAGGTQVLLANNTGITIPGNVGIGTSSPQAKLEVLGNTSSSLLNVYDSPGVAAINTEFAAQIRTYGDSGDGNGSKGGLYVQAGFNQDADIIRLSSVGVGFADAPRMVVKDNGNVGIGTDNPQAKLHISNAQGGSVGRILIDADVSSGYDARIDSTNTGLEFTAKSNLRGIVFNTGTTPTPKVTIGPSGNVGIGTSSPQSKLQVAGDVMVDSGFITLNGNKLGAIKAIIADDAFATITPPRVGAGHISVVEGGDQEFPYIGCHGFVYADWGDSPVVVSISVGTTFEASNAGPPNGTTGSDVHATLFVGGTSGVVYLENRLGNSEVFFVNFL